MVMGECLKSFDWAHDIFLFFFLFFVCVSKLGKSAL